MGGRLDELMACKHTYTNLQKVGGHCHFSTRDVSSKFLAHSAEWEVANLRKGGGGEGGREGGKGEREVNLHVHALLCYTKSYSCKWCQKEFVTKINLRGKKTFMIQ